MVDSYDLGLNQSMTQSIELKNSQCPEINEENI